MNWLSTLITPPVFADDEKTRVGRLLHRVILAGFIINFADVVLLTIFAPETIPTFWVNGLLLVITLVALWLLRQGKVQPGAWAITVMGWLTLTANLLIDGGVASPALGFLSVIIIAGAVLLGPRGAMVFGGLVVVTALLLQIAGANGWLLPVDKPPSQARFFASHTAIFIGLTALMAISGRSVEKALARARRDESELAERNRQLQEESVRREKMEQQQLEMALQKERLDAFREFLSAISHDLKTPLTVIKTNLYLLDKMDDPVRQKEKLVQIHDQTALVEKYVQDVLALSRLDNMPTFTLAQVEVNRIMQHVETRLKPAAEAKQITLKFEADETLPKIMAGEQELYQAFTNLVDNAVHYTLEGGSITITTGKQKRGVFVRVQDNGIGIPAEDIPRLFERFYRSEEAQKIRYGGTGLGLVIVRRIIDIHCGNIEVESSPGQGTTFHIWLPLTPADGLNLSASGASPAGNDSRPGL